MYARDTFLDMLTTKIAAIPSGEIIMDHFESSQKLKKMLAEQNSEWTITYDSDPVDLLLNIISKHKQVRHLVNRYLYQMAAR